MWDSIKPPFGLAASSPNLSESSLAGWAAVLGFAALTLGSFELANHVRIELGSPQDCSWGEGGLGTGAPSGGLGAEPQHHSCGEAAPGIRAEPQPPRPSDPPTPVLATSLRGFKNVMRITPENT